MIWLTRQSFLDTARDLDDALLVATTEWAFERLHVLAYDQLPNGDESDFHPVDLMWTGSELALAAYVQAMCTEAGYRGIVIQVSRDTWTLSQSLRSDGDQFAHPEWMSDVDVLRSHRSNMARRWPKAYGKMWGKIDTTWPYLWPTLVDGEWVLRLSKHDKQLMESGARKLPSAVLERVENS